MGNQSSSEEGRPKQQDEHEYPLPADARPSSQRKTFPGSALLDGTAMLCGIDTTNQSVDQLCSTTPTNEDNDIQIMESTTNPTSALFARALVSEVTDNPNTMTPAKMAEREKKLLKAQDAAKKSKGAKAVGAPGGVGQPSLLGSIAHALGGTAHEEPVATTTTTHHKKTVEPPSSLSENRAQAVGQKVESNVSKHRITVGLSLSRRHSTVGHPDTVTRQTVFDFNELQDREYKYVSSTDATGWRAGGGERGGRMVQPSPSPVGFDEESDYYQQKNAAPAPLQTHKVAAPDTVHIPIIHIDAESPEAVDAIISALARGEVFIPHMAVLPEALSVNGISPPDLVVRFGCERNDDIPPDEWPNWCLEFMHNQLYEYFHSMGARWMKRPFQITLAKKVRWKTVKHMNRYFAHAERVLDAWREKGPQYLDPQLSYIEGGATPEEVSRPHGIYLLRNGVPTNYFAPNFDPPYTTKMTRSLLTNVLDKSWDKKRREWTSVPVPRLVTPATLVGAFCGCTDPTQGGFLANQVTHEGAVQNTVVDTGAATLEDDSRIDDEPSVVTSFHPPQSEPKKPSIKDAPFQLHPIDTSRSPSSGYLEFVSADDVDSSPAANLSNDTSTGTTTNRTRASPLPSPTDNRSPLATNEHLRRAPTPELYRDGASETATSTVTVQHINTSHQLMRSTDSKKSSPKIANGQKKRSFKTKEQRDAEMAREIAKVALLQESGLSGRPAVVEQAIRDPKKMEFAQAVADYEEKKSDSSIPRYNLQVASSDTQSVQRSDSNVSLEYSLDSSMLGGGDSQTTGAYFLHNDTAASIATNTSKRRTAASNKIPSQKSLLERPSEDEPSVTESSLMSNGTSVTDFPPPSDQELFAVGWAKALDPKSGAYYYFTLDRSKIVWDNPLLERSVFSSSTTSSYR